MKILVPTDFSEKANNALEIAYDTAYQMDGEIHLLHILEVPSTEAVSGDIIGMVRGRMDELEANEVPYMMKLIQITKEKIQAIKEKYNKVKITEHVVFDRTHKQIFDFIEKESPDLVIMGSNGATGLDEILIGTNTQVVVRGATCPVLVVKEHIEDFNPRNIILASNFEEGVGDLIPLLKKFQKWFGATVHLVKVITPNNFETSTATHQRIEKFAKDNELEEYTINHFNYFTEEEGIIAFTEEKKGDMIALVTHGRTGMSRFVMGSIAENVCNHSRKAVLTLKLK